MITTLNVGGKQYVVTVYMSSNVPLVDRPWQCKCSSIELDPMTGPKVVADQVQLTNRNGEQPCNHPAIATDGTRLMWAFGSDSENGNTQTYVGLMDHMCRLTSPLVRTSPNPNENIGAPALSSMGNDVLVVGMYNNNGQRTYTRTLKVDTAQSRVNIITNALTVTAPANIGRPTHAVLGPDRLLSCQAKGDQRPPEDGVECTLVNPLTNTIIWKNVVAPSIPAQRIYMNSPSLAKLDGGMLALQVVSSTGEGRNKNKKGTSRGQTILMAPTDAGPNVMTKLNAAGENQVHSGLCAGPYGVGGAVQAAVFDGSITGSGVGSFTVLKADAGKLVQTDKRVVSSNNVDSGYLANIYGQNPHTQGRDFMSCAGGVPNPGYGQAGGFQADTKTFFALPYSGMKPGDPKNALFITLMPGQTNAVRPADPPVDPPPPPVADDPPVTPPVGATGNERWGADASPPGACSIAYGQAGGGAMALFGLALVLGLALRRRR